MRKKRKFTLNLIIYMVGFVFVLPVFVTFIKSMSFNGRFPTLASYSELFIENFTYLDYFWNSFFYSSATSVICIIISIPAGYLFSKVKFWGRDALFFVIIIVMMLPFQATLLPNYIQVRNFNLLDTVFSLTVPMMFSPFAVFLFRQFIKDIPDELIECTQIETSSVIQLFRYAVLPLIKPAIVALVIIIYCESWNMVEQPIIFISENRDILPLSVKLSELPIEVAYSGAMVYMFPILILYFLFKESIQSSMSSYRW